MKKNLLVCLISLFITSTLCAQNVNFKFGKVEKLDGRSNLGMVGSDKENIYVIKRKGHLIGKTDLYLQRYDADLNLKKITELRMPKNNNNDMLFEDISIINNEVKLFTSFYNKKQDKNYSFVNTINDKGLVNPDYNELDQIESKKERNKGEFIFRYSEDSSKILLISQHPYKKGKKESFSCKVFDNTFNVLWERKVELPYKDEKFSFSGYTVSNEGKVFVLGSFELKNKKRKKPGEMYTILVLNNEDKGYKEFDLDIDKFITDIFIKVNVQNDLICAGFYSDEKNKGTKGTIALKINSSTLEIASKSITPFNKEVIASLVGDSKRKQKKGLFRFDIRDLILKDDGGIILIAEQYYIVVVSRRSSSGIVTYTYYYYNNDILAISLKSDVSTEWITHIPKKQLTKNDGGVFNSYAMHIGDGKIYLIFNDNKKNEKNINSKKLKPMSNPNNSNVTLVTIDGSGKMEKKVLYNSKKEKVIIQPKSFMRIDNNTMGLIGKGVQTSPFFYSTKYVLGKVTFE